MEMRKEHYAHTAEDGRMQTVREHLEGTAELAGAFTASFDQGEMGRAAGLLHDIGKYSEAFQRRLLMNGPKVDHSTAGAKVSIEKKLVELAFGIAGHHSGIPDLGSKVSAPEESTLMGRYKRTVPDYSPWKEIEDVLPVAAKKPDWIQTPRDRDMYIRMLYSCLVDADFLDTEFFVMNGALERGVGEPIPVLCEKLMKYIAAWYPPQKKINVERCRILDQCIRAGDTAEQNGIFTLTVPTGGGKTVASLAFALQHAKRLGLQRIIYVIPYTSIIEQTADKFREILGEENVLEHHSGVEIDCGEEGNTEAVKLMRATENWDASVIVTTAVQFFESLYGNRSSKCRKLHRLAKSVIVFDEAQMLPIPYMKPCVSGIHQLCKHYGASAILCTATQPSLGGILKEFDPKIKVDEICPAACYDGSVFKRVTFQDMEQLTLEELADQLQAQEQVLCIVNTRKNAKKLYDLIDADGTYHLSTLMPPAQRRSRLEEIRKRLAAGQVCRVISTSLIEAGVDVDFPFVYREIAGLDSVLQAAGRCNREGKKQAEESVVTVFRFEEQMPSLFRMNADIGAEVIRRNTDISTPEAIQYYFDELMDYKGITKANAFDEKNIMEKMKTYRFAEIAAEFHLIESDTYTVYIPTGEGKELVDRLRNKELSRSLMRKLNQYSVAIYKGQLDALLQGGKVSPAGLSHQEGLERYWILEDMSAYSDMTGLSVGAETGSALFV